MSYDDVECPYCEHMQDIDHDDGYGYEQETFHKQVCEECEKTFTYVTNISYYYEAFKADCLNGSEHTLEKHRSNNPCYDVMRCTQCEYEKYERNDRPLSDLNN